MPLPVPLLLLLAVGGGIVVAKKKAAASKAAAAAGAPPTNPNTKMVVFGRFMDEDLAAGDLVQCMSASGTAYVLQVTGATSASYGPAFIGTPAPGNLVNATNALASDLASLQGLVTSGVESITSYAPAEGAAGIVFQSQDVAAIAPAGSSATDPAAWTTSESDLPPVLQAFNLVAVDSIPYSGSAGTAPVYVRLQDTRGAGTAIVALLTAMDPTTGQFTGAPTYFQGIILPPTSITFSAANVQYVATDQQGTPPAGATAAPLTNPVFQASPAGFTLNHLVEGDVVILTTLGGIPVEAVLLGWGPGGIQGQETSGPNAGATILFDVSEIQGVALSSNPGGFFTSPAALLAAEAATTPAAA